MSTVEEYVAAVPAEHVGLFDRITALLRHDRADVEVAMSYGILRYSRNASKVYLGVWKHGVSLYGWASGGDAGFSDRHPELLSGRGTLKICRAQADTIDDAEFLALFDAVLGSYSKRDGSPAPTRTTSG